MLFKHQLPRPLRDKDTPLLEAEVSPSAARCPNSVLIAAKSGRRHLHIFKWDRFLGVVEAPAEVTCCKLVSLAGECRPCVSLVVGCRSGSVYRVEDVEARMSTGANGGECSSTGTLCLGSEHLCSSFPDDASQIDKLMVGSREGAKESSEQTVVAVLRRDAETVVYHMSKDTPPADFSTIVLDPPGHPLACLPAPTGGDTILLHVCHDRNQGPPTPSGGFHLYSALLAHDTTIKEKQKKGQAVILHTFHEQVVAVLPVPMRGNKGATLVAVERDGLLSLLPDPRAKTISQSNAEQIRIARLLLSPAEGGLQAAVLVGNSDIIACLSTRGSVWFARLSLLFPGRFSDDHKHRTGPSPSSSFPSSSSVNCMRVDCAPEVVALAAPSSFSSSSPSSSSSSSSSPQQLPVLYLLTRRGRILCFQDFPSIPSSSHISGIPSIMAGAATTAASSTTPPPPAAAAAAADAAAGAATDETETLLHQIEQACHQTKASHQQIAHTEEAIEKVRMAWTVLAGKGLLETFLDVIHPFSSSPSPSPLLKVRLHNPTENETLPLQGWSLMVRIEAASASAAQGPSALLLKVISPPAAAVLVGASWGLDDVGPGEDFEAHMVLPVTGSLLPHTVRVTLCCPFAGAGDGRSKARASSLGVQQSQQQKEVGVCLELGSRPLDVLDLARPPKTVPVTPAEMRTMEATAAKRGRNQSWEGSLAHLLFEKVEFDDEEDGHGGGRRGRKEEVGKGGNATMPTALPRPLISSTLRILWPAVPGREQEHEHEVMDGNDVPPATCLPALIDLLGPCDGAEIVEEGGGRALALQAPGSKLLLARLLAGEARIRMDENESKEATGLQLSLTGTDQGLVSLLRAACCQRLGVGGSVRTRRLPLTDTRMKVLETAHYQVTALAAELQEAIERDVVEEEGTLVQAQQKCLQKRLRLARRVMTLAMVLAKEVDEAFLLDLRPGGAEEREFEKEGVEADDIQDEEGYFNN